MKFTERHKLATGCGKPVMTIYVLSPGSIVPPNIPKEHAPWISTEHSRGCTIYFVIATYSDLLGGVEVWHTLHSRLAHLDNEDTHEWLTELIDCVEGRIAAYTIIDLESSDVQIVTTDDARRSQVNRVLAECARRLREEKDRARWLREKEDPIEHEFLNEVSAALKEMLSGTRPGRQ